MYETSTIQTTGNISDYRDSALVVKKTASVVKIVYYSHSAHMDMSQTGIISETRRQIDLSICM